VTATSCHADTSHGAADRMTRCGTASRQMLATQPSEGSPSRAGATFPLASCAASLRPAADPQRRGQQRDSPGRGAAFLALAYGCGLRRSEAVAIDPADLDLVDGELRVRRGKGRPCRHRAPSSGSPDPVLDLLLVRRK
jgi:integrase